MFGSLRLCLLVLLISCGSSEPSPSSSGAAGRAGTGGTGVGGNAGAAASGGTALRGGGGGASTAGSNAAGLGGAAGANAVGGGGAAGLGSENVGGATVDPQGGFAGDEVTGGDAGSDGGNGNNGPAGCERLLACCEMLDDASEREACSAQAGVADSVQCDIAATELYITEACEPVNLSDACEAVLQCCVGAGENLPVLSICLDGLAGGDADRCTQALDLLSEVQAC